jgi:hypothetical protein
VEDCGERVTQQLLVGWQWAEIWLARLSKRYKEQGHGSAWSHFSNQAVRKTSISTDAGVKRQIVNQVEGHSEICTKTRLAENLRRYANDQKLDCCWVPETFVVSAGYNEGKSLDLL